MSAKSLKPSKTASTKNFSDPVAESPVSAQVRLDFGIAGSIVRTFNRTHSSRG
jgi:hypothetical protein